MIRLQLALDLAGVVFLGAAVLIAMDRAAPRRFWKAAFWGLFGVSFLFGGRLGDLGNGVLVLALVLIGASGALGVKSSAPAAAFAETASPAAIFLPILVVPLATVAGTLLLPAIHIAGQPLAKSKEAAQIALAGAVVLGLIAAMAALRPRPVEPLVQGRRVIELVGWAAILPQLLAALGAVFAKAGVGMAVGALIARFMPDQGRLSLVVLYCGGMAVFTLIMGNAFAAFPVLVAAIGAPLLIGRYGADPAIVGALGMLSGYCGTLMTPMASHNIVPAALLDLRPIDVIRVQAPTALVVLAANILILDLFAFRR